MLSLSLYIYNIILYIYFSLEFDPRFYFILLFPFSLFLKKYKHAMFTQDFTGEQTDCQYFGLSVSTKQENKSLREVNRMLFFNII